MIEPIRNPANDKLQGALSMAVKPMSPEEVLFARAAQFPDALFIIINNKLASEKRTQFGIRIDKPWLLRRLRDAGHPPEEVIENGWLRFEEFYEGLSWRVVHHPHIPGMCSAHWTFY